MKSIICRFDSNETLERLFDKFGIKVNRSVKEFDLDNLFYDKIISTSKKPSINDKHDTKRHYVGMPEFKSKEIKPFHKVVFKSNKSSEELSEIFEQNITDQTKSIWFPKLEIGKYAKYRVVGGNAESKYPIYVVSKNRKDHCSTSVFLSNMEVKHYVVVEPSDYNDYVNSIQNEFCTILELDMKFQEEYDTFDDLGDTKSKGPGSARNFCWDHSIKNGFDWHWVMDDNANEGFHWLYQNAKIKSRCGSFFRAIEDFVDRYSNIAIAGLNYTKFCMENEKTTAFVLNTRIYSFLLIRNDIDYRWKGRYNEDTDLSLRVLRGNWCTIQFNTFLAGKATTQKIQGGNTEEFYAHEGTLNKSKMLEEMHPDVAKVMWRFSRWHHYVDYSGFRQKLKLKDDVDLNQLPLVDNRGMKIIKTEEEGVSDTKEFLEDKYKHLLDDDMPIFNNHNEEKKNILKSKLFKKKKL